MKTKSDKDKQEWQTAMETMEKQVMDRMQKYWGKWQARWIKNEKLKQNMKDLVGTKVGDLKKEMREINKEPHNLAQKLKKWSKNGRYGYQS